MFIPYYAFFFNKKLNKKLLKSFASIKDHSARTFLIILFSGLFSGLFLGATGLFASLLLPSQARAFNESQTDEQLLVKAAFILNLARFVEWPDEAKNGKITDVVLCFYQYNFLDQAVNSIRNKKINNKPVSIKVIDQLKINERCEIVLIPAMMLSTFLQYNAFENLQNRVTISDMTITDLNKKFANIASLENKIIFRLKRYKSRLRFEVNKEASERLGIIIGSELLKLGIIVKDPDGDRKREGQ